MTQHIERSPPAQRTLVSDEDTSSGHERDDAALQQIKAEIGALREQIAVMTSLLEQVAGPQRALPSAAAPSFESTLIAPVDASPPPFPSAKELRRVIRSRELRKQHFKDGLFADPAWDMLLDLAASVPERKRVSVSSLCLAAGVPASTALRWIGLLVDAGYVNRNEDAADRRRVFVELTDSGIRAMTRYFADLTAQPPRTV